MKPTKKTFTFYQLQILQNVVRQEIKKETKNPTYKKRLFELKNIYTDLHINNK